jgi:hypothetical protein
LAHDFDPGAARLTAADGMSAMLWKRWSPSGLRTRGHSAEYAVLLCFSAYE